MDTFEVLQKYNFWDGKSVQTGLKRDAVLAKMVNCLGNRLIKIITGQRRSGKSYLMRQLIYHLIENGVSPANILYINK